MKHGPIVFVSETCPRFLAAREHILQNHVANIQEMRSRHAKMIAIANANNQSSEKFIDDLILVRNVHAACQPIVPTISFQLFANCVVIFRRAVTSG
jgi:glucosamine--fructose-6-phosphate aminotransferase (isomerizing)